MKERQSVHLLQWLHLDVQSNGAEPNRNNNILCTKGNGAWKGVTTFPSTVVGESAVDVLLLLLCVEVTLALDA